MITIKEYTEQLETENRTLYEDKNYWKKLAEKRKYQIQQKENIIKEVRKKLIKSKEYQAVKSLGFNSKMSVLIEMEEILEKEVADYE